MEILEMNMFYVGFGDCIHLTFPNDEQLLIDTGCALKFQRVQDKLKEEGKRVDYLLLTHSHVDHINGALKCINEFKVKRIIWWLNESGRSSPSNIFLKRKIIKEISEFEKKQSVPIIYSIFEAVRSIPIFKKYFELIYPILEKQPFHDNPNQNSIVLALHFHNNHLLFMGDATEVEEHEILNSKKSNIENTTLVKIGHHGSDTSTSMEFQNALNINPNRLLICSNKENWTRKPPSREKINQIRENPQLGKLHMTGLSNGEKHDIKIIYIYCNESATDEIEEVPFLCRIL